MTDPRAVAKMARYDLVVVTRCGEAWQEMERADEYGDWVTYEDHSAALADARRAGLEEAAEIACNTCLCPADVAYDNGLPNQTQGDSYNAACLQIMDKIRAQAQAKQEAP